MTNSERYFEQSKELIPGGVNSPVRAFGSVSATPVFIERGDGAYLFDVDGNQYIDYVGSWGPLILGHNNPQIFEAIVAAAKKGVSFGAATQSELTMARLLTELTGIEMVRMVNSGTEAVMSALRVARGFTQKDKIIKFEGCYHGHSDSMLTKAGSGALTYSNPDSAGVTKAVARDTLVARYNDIQSVVELFAQNQNEIAAIIVEPVAANMGVVLPSLEFLKTLRTLCDENNCLLIFDEVITGFRLGIGGAQAFFGVQADLVTYGKIIGAGMPVGAYGGRRDIMACVSPVGAVYQAGTLSGNPVAMAAGITQLTILREHPEIYTHIETLCTTLADGLRSIIKEYNIEATVANIGSLCCLFLGKERYTKFFKGMLARGIYLAPSQYEALFIGFAHTAEDIEKTITSAKACLEEIK